MTDNVNLTNPDVLDDEKLDVRHSNLSAPPDHTTITPASGEKDEGYETSEETWDPNMPPKLDNISSSPRHCPDARESPDPIAKRPSITFGRQGRVVEEHDWDSNYASHIEEIKRCTNPAPPQYTPPPSPQLPPSYHTYEGESQPQPPQAPYLEFPKHAILFALCASRPPQPSAAEEMNRGDREAAEHEQSVFLSSIRYGDQLNRGLDELSRFREDRVVEIEEGYGIAREQIERRMVLNRWEEGERWDGAEALEDQGEE